MVWLMLSCVSGGWIVGEEMHMCAENGLTICSVLYARAHKNGRLKWEHVTPIEAHSQVEIIKNRIPGHVLRNNYVYQHVQYISIYVTIFSTASLILHSYMLLLKLILMRSCCTSYHWQGLSELLLVLAVDVPFTFFHPLPTSHFAYFHLNLIYHVSFLVQLALTPSTSRTS